MPYDGYFGDDFDTADFLEAMLTDKSSGLDAPAAILLETVQGEGGLNAASADWVRRVAALARRQDHAQRTAQGVGREVDTSDFHVEVIDLLGDADIGMAQIPCPEIACLGFERPRPPDKSIRQALEAPKPAACCRRLAARRPAGCAA